MHQSPSDEILSTAVRISAERLKRQHELAAEFGFAAIRMPNFLHVLDQACEVVCRGLGTRYAKVLRYCPEENNFLLIAGRGFDAEDIGVVRLGADNASPAGYAYANSCPVVSNHLGAEERFRTPQLLAEKGIERAINVVIRGVPVSYGVLECDSPEGDDFTEVDIVFMEAIANVIAFANARIEREHEARGGDEFSANILDASPDCIAVLSGNGEVLFINRNGMQLMEIDDPSSILGTLWADLWEKEYRQQIAEAVAQAAQGDATRLEGRCPTFKGNSRWWDVSVAPLEDARKGQARIVLVARDVTERREQEEHLARILSEQEVRLDHSELMVQEVHHRVSNSLHLVHTLLELQGSLASESLVKMHLQEAAARVMTVGSVHKRLYQHPGQADADATQYLKVLLQELHSSFASREIDRAIHFHGEGVMVAASRLTAVGLVAAELVTNAIKYGRGDVTVWLARQAGQIKLTVDDQGNGFPDSFPTPQGTGLGMRLVRMYARGSENPVSVDRSVPFSRIVVSLPAS